MNRRILVIDDQDTILDDFRNILCPSSRPGHRDPSQVAAAARLLGFQVPEEESQEVYELSTARQGKEGYELIQAANERGEPFALAFIDIRMPPGWDGMRTAAEIRRIDPDIELVIVTAYSDRDRKEIVKTVGTPEKLLYLKKPFDVEEIRQLALCLTRKWGLHKKEKCHRQSLERLLEKITSIKTFMGDSQKLMETVLEEVREEVGAEKGLIVSIENGEINIEARYGQFDEKDIYNIINKVSKNDLRSGTIMELGEYLILPLRTEGLEVIVVFGNHIKEGDKPFLKLFLSSMSELINNARLFEKGLRNEKMASIGLATKTILHDLRNPLTLMAGSVDFCLGQPDFPERLRRYMWSAREGTCRITEILADVSDYTLGSIHIRKTPVRLASLLQEGFALWNEQLMRNEVELSVEVGEDLVVSVDRNRFHRVLDNLISNASEAMELSLRKELAIWSEENGDRVLVKIRDTGPGIPEEIRPRVFDPFRSYGKRTGTGLGLAIVKEFVELHGGHVRFETGSGGTTFTIDLPAVR